MSIATARLESIKSQVNAPLIRAFTELGRKAALDAYRKSRYRGKVYKDRTYNLNTSYGSAVYVNGVLIEDSITTVNSGGYTKPDKRAPSGYETGDQALKTFFKTAFVVRKRDTYTILVAAAMWYASMVEKKGFKVIELDDAKKYIALNFDNVVGPILKSNNLQSILPLLRKGIGVDTEYFRFGGRRHK
jgi:hypothetical protein